MRPLVLVFVALVTYGASQTSLSGDLEHPNNAEMEADKGDANVNFFKPDVNSISMVKPMIAEDDMEKHTSKLQDICILRGAFILTQPIPGYRSVKSYITPEQFVNCNDLNSTTNPIEVRTGIEERGVFNFASAEGDDCRKGVKIRVQVTTSLSQCPAIEGCEIRLWGYAFDNGPEKWESLGAPRCRGFRQSPIDIETRRVVPSISLNAFVLTNYDTVPHAAEWMLINKGRAVRFRLLNGLYKMSGGGLPLGAEYRLHCVHFHVGSDDFRGSEHTIDGRRFPMEIHMVHYNMAFGTFEEALQASSDSLAVWAFHVEIQPADNPAFDRILFNLPSVEYPCHEIPITPFPLHDLMPTDMTKFYRYSGSLTTPGCFETVVWTVFKDTVKLSERQLNILRTVPKTESEHLVDNFRPVQPLNGRVVMETAGIL